ncbi:MAG: CsbD family protein [Roseiarcus sp.]
MKGAAKIAVGKAVGDAKLQSDGKVDSAIGKAQNAVGGASDAIRDATKVK